MSKQLRDAAQALLDAIDSKLNDVVPYEQLADLRIALSAPEPTADERVAEHMRLVFEFKRDDYILSNELEEYAAKKSKQREAVEQSARALLSASQDDAEHAAMYRWLRGHAWHQDAHDYGCTDYRFPILPRTNYSGTVNHATVDDAISAAMKVNP